jgi:hypothetical protein
MMARLLYRCLLRLHPFAFRQQFAGEMLWIFDEAAASEGVFTLFADGAVSLLRQWLIGCGTWKIAAAAIGGMLYMGLAFALVFSSWRLVLPGP